ncbi:nonribosomal peptide synthetase [Histoplasma capsulatum H143]|uniref:Nonribosomal peptide synthetase n=1 Tax=Ajellomyces capsulatus (strain H143) TaxID=544712 RepID=C6HSH9_AJECH|nr:nonribosomal peptide synthetase [Histoplasma capsulatum H143]
MVVLIPVNNRQILSTFFIPDNENPTRSDGILIPMSDGLMQKLIEARTFLKDYLPIYMVPTMYIPLVHFPLTSNGKLDHRCLCDIVLRISETQLMRYMLISSSHEQQQMTVVQKRLRIMWASYLDLAEHSIGINDNFFNLGGDSVSAIRLASAARSSGISLTVSDIFRCPTLLSMAAASKETNRKEDEAVIPFSLSNIEQNDLSQKLHEIAFVCGVQSNQIEDIYPCSPLQEGLLALSMQTQSAYTLRRVFRLGPRIDLEEFKNAWQTLINALPILRTRVVKIESGFSQVVVKENDIPWREESSLDKFVECDSNMSISHGAPLHRLGMVIEDAGDRYLIWTVHHAIFDAWSIVRIFEYLAKLYTRKITVGSLIAHLPPYSLFIRHLCERSESMARSYWLSELAHGSPATYPQQTSFHGSLPHSSFTVSKDIELPRKSESDNVTISNILRAAWSILISKYADSNDIVIGVTLSGRNAPVPKIAEIIGPTITTVPVRVCIDWADNVPSFLLKIQEQATTMIPFEHFGLQNIRRISPELHYLLNLQNLLIVHSLDERDVQLIPDMDVLPTPDDGFDTYPLVIECRTAKVQNHISIDVRSNPGVISPMQTRRMLDQFANVVHQLCQGTTQTTLADIITISPEDAQQLIQWNGQDLEPVHECVHETVTRAVRTHPSSLAICSWDGDMTYEMLDRFSNQLARHIIKQGIRRGNLVPHCLNKSKWAIVVTLAILKAGGASVAVGPRSPLQRLAGNIQTLDAPLMLVDEENRCQAESLGIPLITISECFMMSLDDSDQTIDSGVRSNEPAFVVFTSGSTGQPKAIVLQHDSICYSARAHGSSLGIGRGSRVLQYAAYTFDVSIQDNFTTLMRGGCVCILSEEARVNIVDLISSINILQANWACLTSTVASLLKPSDVPCLSTLVLGGEPASQDVVAVWAGHVTLHNVYGPAEASIWSACNENLGEHSLALNIGKSLASRLWVANPANHHNLVPIGCVGELLIEGPLLARGYLHDPELTSTKFIYNPSWVLQLGLEQPKRLYKRAICIPSEFVSQIVAEFVRKQYQNDRHTLVAFLEQSDDIDESEFCGTFSPTLKRQIQHARHVLEDNLPSYMIPSMFIPLARLPRNASGKLDRGKLQQYFMNLSSTQLNEFMLLSEVKTEPKSAMEIQLRDIWTQELKVSGPIGLEDSFFELGGDSISAMRLVAAARDIGIFISVADVFQFPRLGNLASAVMQSNLAADCDYRPYDLWHPESPEAIEEIASLCQISKDEIEDILPTTPLQEGLTAISTRKKGTYVSQSIHKLGKNTSVELLISAWNKAVEDLPILRTRLVTIASGTFQVVVRHEPVWNKGPSLKHYLANDMKEPILNGSPLLRLGLIDDHGRDGIINKLFVITVHHGIYDAWSAAKISDYVSAVYSGIPVPVTKPFGQFMQYLNKIDLAANEAYWRKQLKSPPNVGFLSSTLADTKHHCAKTASRQINIPHKPQFVTMATILRATWILILSQYSKSGDVIFAMTLSGREAPITGASEIIGPLFTTVPVRAKVELTTPIYEFLCGVQAQATEMLPFEHFGLHNIRRLEPEIQAALDGIQHLFVVQSSTPSQAVVPSIYSFESRQALDIGFTNYALVIECLMLEGITEVRAIYYDDLISTTEIQSILDQFSFISNTLLETSGEQNTLLSSLNLPFKKQSGPKKVHNLLHADRESGLDIHKKQPTSEMELKLQKLWAEEFELNSTSIGVSSNFFHLGGDSVSAMRLAAASRRYGIQLKVADIFQYPTLSEMARAATTARSLQKPSGYDEQDAVEPFSLWLVAAGERKDAISDIAEQCQIEPNDIEDVYPCTPLQEALIVPQQAPVYVLQKIFKLPEDLSLEHFKFAWQKTVKSNPILRTRIIPSSPCSLQVIIKEDIQWELRSSLKDYLKMGINKSFTYGARLARYVLVHDKSGLYFVWTLHHSIYDGMSIALLFKQVSRIYSHGRSDLTVPFNRFVKYLASRPTDSAKPYWRGQLSGQPNGAFPQPLPQKVNTNYTIHVQQHLELHNALPMVPVAAVLRAAWALIVSKYSNHDDIIFGAALSGRDIPEEDIMKIVGPTVTTVPIRVRIDYRNATVASFLESIHQQALQMASYAQTGVHNIRQICQDMRPAVDFNSFLAIHPSSDDMEEFLGLEEIVSPYRKFGNFPLINQCHLKNSNVQIELFFDSAALSEIQGKALLNQFCHLIKQLATLPGNTPLLDIEFITPEDTQQINIWNQRSCQEVKACLHDAFQRQALNFPKNPAVSSLEGENLTYVELERLSSTLAKSLNDSGVGSETMVPLMFRKSPWAIVAILAVLKAGGACVPLDPQHPPNRLHMIIKDIKASLILVDTDCFEPAKSLLPSQRIITIDRATFRALPSISHYACSTVTPSNSAFVIYTSGTTGVPKGVVLEHRAICTNLDMVGEVYGVGPSTRIGQFASYAFDISIQDIFLALHRGACICVIDERHRMDDLAFALRSLRVNWMNLTSTVARLLQPEDVPNLSTLVLAGELMREDVIEKWKHVVLINSYGSAETSISTSFNRGIQHVTQARDIGLPLRSLSWIVDEDNHDKLNPIGVPGELLVEGPLLARGYLNDEIKTRESFIVNPAWAAGQRLNGGCERRFYKTGDLVRYSGDGSGSLVFIRRVDNQLKVRRQLVEAAEIEHYIAMDSPASSGVAVTLVPTHEGETDTVRETLAAFIRYEGQIDTENTSDILIPSSDALRDTHSALREKLAQILPSYMVPSYYFPVHRLPFTVSGKLDRQVLVATISCLGQDELLLYVHGDESIKRVQNSTQETLRHLWAEELGVPVKRIGFEDNFFALGGDSVSAMRLASRCRSNGISLAARDIISHPSLRGMSSIIDPSHCKAPEAGNTTPFSLLQAPDLNAFVHGAILPQTRLPSNEITDILPVTEFQAMCLSGALSPFRWTLNYFHLDCRGTIDTTRLQESWAKLVNTYELLRSIFTLHEGTYYQVIPKFWHPQVDIYEAEGEIISLSDNLEKQDLRDPPSLGRPWAKLVVIKGSKFPQQTRIILRMSHAQYDGICLSRLWDDLASAYKGENLLLPRLGFADYIAIVNRQTRDKRTLDHWNTVLEGSKMTKIIAGSDVAPPLHLSSEMAFLSTRQIQIPHNYTSRLFSDATIIKAAWSLVLSRLRNSSYLPSASVAGADIIFGGFVSSRNTSVGISQVFGPCLNILPIRVPFNRQMQNGVQWTYLDLLTYIRDQQIASIPFENAEFGKIVSSEKIFSSYVQHQNIDSRSTVPLGDAIFEITSCGAERDFADVVVFSQPIRCRQTNHEISETRSEVDAVAPSTIDITIKYARERVPVALADKLLDAVCCEICAITSAPEKHLN